MSQKLTAHPKDMHQGLRAALYALLTLALAFAVHALVLAFVFPRYYDPLWPNHDDFYVPISMVHSPLGFWDYIWFPRPTGQLFFLAIGHLGLHGSVFAVLLLVMMNCALIGEIVRRFAELPANPAYLASYALYLFLLFSQPHFYEFASHDAFAQLSFFLLTVSTFFFYRFHKTGKLVFLVTSFITAFMGFLAKETYGLTLIFLGLAWLIAYKRKGWLRASLPMALAGTALAVALTFNFLQQSPFTSNTGGDKSPYHVVLAPVSIVTEWLRYATDGLNALSSGSLAIVLCSILIFLPKKLRWLGFVLPLSAVLAWIPNALLPNHHYSGYSWSGAYLLFSPVLFVSALLRSGWKPAVFGLAAIITALTSPMLFDGAYKKNDWAILQENNERNLLKALAGLDADLAANSGIEKVLVTGINFPFSPFNQTKAIDMFPHMRKVRFAVVSYSIDLPVSTDEQVHFVTPRAVRVSDYQAIWAFEPDGKLASHISDPREIMDGFPGVSGFNPSHLILYPKLIDVFGEKGGAKPDGYTYLKCGTTLLSYGDEPGAETCLKLSSEDIPDNPYPFFYLGKAQEEQGKDCLALQSYRRAVALDDPKRPNAYFSSAMKRVNCSLGRAMDNASLNLVTP